MEFIVAASQSSSDWKRLAKMDSFEIILLSIVTNIMIYCLKHLWTAAATDAMQEALSPDNSMIYEN